MSEAAHIGEVLERESPGFWRYFKTRHSKFAGYGGPDEGPIGYLHAFEVYAAIADTIPAYVRDLSDEELYQRARAAWRADPNRMAFKDWIEQRFGSRDWHPFAAERAEGRV